MNAILVSTSTRAVQDARPAELATPVKTPSVEVLPHVHGIEHTLGVLHKMLPAVRNLVAAEARLAVTRFMMALDLPAGRLLRLGAVTSKSQRMMTPQAKGASSDAQQARIDSFGRFSDAAVVRSDLQAGRKQPPTCVPPVNAFRFWRPHGANSPNQRRT